MNMVFCYDRTGWLNAHLSWHRALLALEQDDPERALALYRDRIHPAAAHAAPLPILADGASLLWRLDLNGHAVARETWDDAAAFAGPRFPKSGLAFAEVHMAHIAAATGDRAALAARIAEMEQRLAEGALPQGPVGPAVCRAIAAFADGDYAGPARLLEPAAADLVRLGGSHAQREAIKDTLLVAHMRAGEPAKARALLDARLHRRPSPRDARWRAAVGS